MAFSLPEFLDFSHFLGDHVVSSSDFSGQSDLGGIKGSKYLGTTPGQGLPFNPIWTRFVFLFLSFFLYQKERTNNRGNF